MSDNGNKKANELESEFRKLVIDELRAISTKQEETNNSISNLTTEFKLHKQESENRWDTIARLDAEQNAILSEHAARSKALQKQNELMEKSLRADIFGEGIQDSEKRETTVIGRLEKLEEPRRFIKSAKKLLIGLGKVAGAVMALYGLFKLLQPHL